MFSNLSSVTLTRKAKRSTVILYTITKHTAILSFDCCEISKEPSFLKKLTQLDAVNVHNLWYFGDFELLPKLVTTEFFGIPEDERSCDLLVGHNINMTPEK